MKVFFKVLVMVYTLIGISLFASDNVLATVNGSAITQNDVNDFVVVSTYGTTFSALSEKEKKVAVNKMIDIKLVLEDATRMNIEDDPQFILDLKRKTKELILDHWMKKKVEEIFIDDREAKIYYRDNYVRFTKPASVKVRHILLLTEIEARVIIKKLNANKERLIETFIALAKDKSTGPSAINGGELDWFIQEQMVPEFSEVAFTLKKGTITQDAVQTQFGYHVIYLEDKKEEGIVPFEMVKEGILKELRLSKFKPKLKKLRKKLREKAKIQ
jgi:parvulin-like peptidyl-prolyl isomerase